MFYRHLKFENILFFIKPRCAPIINPLVENNGPLIFIGNGIQSIGTRCYGVTVKEEFFPKTDCSGRIGPRSPNFAVRNQVSKNTTPLNARATVIELGERG